jgi:uncharacterized protein (TIGR02594 family)
MKEYPWMKLARSKLYEHEVAGHRANKFIVECLKSTDIGAPENASDETPWCSAFVNWVMTKSGYKGTNSAWARSWRDWGREPADEEFGKGVIVVLERGPESGHVGFLEDWEEDQVYLLGGNQGNEVSFAWFPMSRVLAWRIPK